MSAVSVAAPRPSGPSRLKAERSPAVLLQVELRNFTRMSEMLDAERVLQLASAFFSLAGAAIKQQGGEVFSVQNDSLVAAFRAPTAAQSAAQALAAAQAMLGEFEPLGERWKTDFGLPATLAVGLHAGDTVFGMAGPHGGEQYVAFGDTVSITERLVHRARAGEIVFSAVFVKALGTPAAARLGAQALPPLELGKRPALPLFGVLLESRLDFT
ncbi:MAG TPA: adenylate/guanylate cyclase domain-containing protein [Burkholderiales bacterium]|jgi:adenylate cyclase|nr:adenylate/guanylate cyclase domain-containing protein [Burkholderiales bacterium]